MLLNRNALIVVVLVGAIASMCLLGGCSKSSDSTHVFGDEAPEHPRDSVELVGTSSNRTFKAPSVKHVAERRILIDGNAQTKYSYLLVSKPRQFAANTFIVADGAVTSGGLSIGIQRANTWITKFTVDEPGPFRMSIKIPADGEYQLVLANAVASDGSRNTVEVSSLKAVR